MSYSIEYSGTFPLAPDTKPQDILALAETHEVADLISPDTLLTHREIDIVDGAIEGTTPTSDFRHSSRLPPSCSWITASCSRSPEVCWEMPAPSWCGMGPSTTRRPRSPP